MIIEELRKNFESAQIQLAKEQTEKLVRIGQFVVKSTCVLWVLIGYVVLQAANDSLGKEKEAKLAVEKAQAGLTEELGKAQGELQTANQRVRKLKKKKGSENVKIAVTPNLDLTFFVCVCSDTICK